MKIDLKKGDIILTGKWKNKKVEVKEFGTNELGQPTVNGKPILNVRIEKLMPKKKNEKKGKKVNESLDNLKKWEDFD